MKVKPDLSFWKLWNISFGFFGVQIAYALQSANISRIFATLGADPHNLSYFWILPPLAGIIVQPIIGSASDKTWTRFGRRIPYLFIGSLVAVLVMCLLPNAGSFGMAVSTAMIFGLISLMFLDTSINMAMQPFKMLVGDMVNEKQKGLAYSIQSFLCNAGSLMGYLFPFLFTWIGINNVAAKGTVPDSVIYSFYIGSAILMLCVIYTSVKVKEMPPKEFEEFHGITADEKQEKTDFISLLKHAPKVFWTVGLVQFFSWAAFMYMWTYTNGAIADTVWNTTNVQNAGYQEAGNWVGILFAVQAIGSVVWAVILPLFKSRKLAYSLSLLLGGCGFVSTLFFTDQYLLFISYLLIGCAWAAMLAMPFTILTNSISGKNMGAYLGLFNGTICIPQIVAAVVGGGILHLVGGKQINMLVLAGALLMIGACCVYFVKETVVHTNDK
ncbi:MAG: MFS transporter [Bacteroides graminisolvens]|jgi:Na+/melibiose symporter and related transporters|uniref:Sugar transporter n=2 Tax=Bacteroides graminisolvens TaxID=477666 RepID=A0A069D4S9_9BACE|nr:MFS transporter [Bacteroides graminisolvens]MBP6139662.1 SLC45 family MFS transporter [Bacteroides sp.]MBP6248084.1 SLC45 family MFS transporter [Bacteroides sp.]MBP7292645.1 SLC45 family MFS transporter [Bacteroides sp.]MBP9496343.1 SLC45 family MFS transporter [Bacteroides sp.]MBP9721147.1 SLC45 family MFS transporter [Bacteroides sp.]